MRNAMIGLLLAVAVLTSADAQVRPETRWTDPSKVVLAVDFPGDGYHAEWDLYRCACGDLLVYSELNVPGDVEKGETLLVGRRAVLYRGFPEHEAEYGASLDAPALMMQLTGLLLERLEPGGPSRVTGPVERSVTDEEQNIYLDTGTATGTFQAPWTASGTLAPAGENARRFDVKLEFSVQTAEGVQHASMRFKGTADYAREDFPVPGDEPLSNWTLSWRDSEDAATGPAAGAKTLDALRAVIAETEFVE